MQSNNKLPSFHAGDSLANQLTESKLTQLVEYVRGNTPVSGVGIRVKRTSSGSVIESTDRGRKPSGSYSPGYVLGSTNYGSSTSGPGGITGPWGGSGDAQSGSANSPYTDTWDADRAPRNTSNADTYGVKLTLLRVATGSSTKIFIREPELDSSGMIKHIPGETLLVELFI
jgi:hypothetical protein